MKMKSIVSKEAHILAAWYDLIHCSGLLKDHLYAYYFGDMSKFLYFSYVVEGKKLWIPLLKCICLGVNYSNPLIQKVIDIIKSIEVCGWREFEEYIKNNLTLRVEELFNSTLPVLQDFIRKAFNIDLRNLKELYVIYGFNPGRGLYGSLLYYCRDYIITSVFVNEYLNHETILDLIYHELLHAVIRLYNLNIPDEIEEELVDSLTPEGYLSILLGLTNKVRVGESRVSKIIEEYFRNKLFNEKIPLYQYLLQKLSKES